MKNFITLCIFNLISVITTAQNFTIEGKIFSKNFPVKNAEIQIENTTIKTQTNNSGVFYFSLKKGIYSLLISAEGFASKQISISVEKNTQIPVIELDSIYLETFKNDFISLSEEEIDNSESGSVDAVSGVLHASNDLYFQRTSFDFSQVFFRPRGYDSKEAVVLINGIPMNKVKTGRALWSNWGGLNDFTRNQITTTGISASDYDFGGVLGSNFISIRPWQNREGAKISVTAANRGYSGRLMATYNARTQNGIAYSLSASRRWANTGNFIDGILNNSYAFAGAVEYKANPFFWVNLVGMYSFNHRGKSAPLTQEAIALGGRHYNPNWGYLNGNIRNSKMNRVAEPIFILSHTYKKENVSVSVNLGYQFGQIGNTRLEYANVQNPNPLYYTQMPSYYYSFHSPENSLRHDPFALYKTALQIEYFKENKQIPWENLYRANHNNEQSLYALTEEISDTKTFTANILTSIILKNNLKINGGFTFQNTNQENFEQISDLLGGKFFLNKSSFSGEWYNTTNEKLRKNDKYQYNYAILSQKISAFVQAKIKIKKADIYGALQYQYTDYQRNGFFNNNAIYTDSKGNSAVSSFHTISAKAGGSYAFTGRHYLQFNTGFFQKAQNPENIFTNIRHSNSFIPTKINTENQLSADVSYIIKMPYFNAKLTGYFSNFFNGIEKNYFFTQTRNGDESAGFLTETTTNSNKTHFGVEFGSEIQIIPTLKLSFVATYNKYKYTNNPLVFYSSDQQLISSPTISYLKNYRIGAGPEQAYSIGLEYRNPKFWWISGTANLFNNNFVSVANILRTSNIYTDPNTGNLFNSIDIQKTEKLLKQENLGSLFLVNFSTGKSWRIKNKYISIYASINNLLNKQFKASGFEQARKGNYQAMVQDAQNGYPVFGNKYFTGYGTTYFINTAINF